MPYLSRLAKQKVLQADFDKEISSVRGQVDGLKSKNNVSINTQQQSFMSLCSVAAIKCTLDWLLYIFVRGPETVLLSGPQKQK